MTINFKYKSVERPDKSRVKTPSIPIILSSKNRIETTALIDSGADVSVVSLGIARILGLELDKPKTKSFGVGGEVDTIETRMNINIEKGHEHYRLQIPVKVIIGDYNLPILLGRVGFFENFIISFDQRNERVSLKKN